MSVGRQSTVPSHGRETLLGNLQEEVTMHQEIPEHPASHMANLAVILAIVLAIIYMIKVWH